MKQVIDFFSRLLDTTDWPPRWHCGKWTAFHGWLYIISDLLVWSAYFVIPIVIIRYITRKAGARFVKLYFLFAAFILACGATHFLDAAAFWVPMYRLSALVRLFTGIISWVTVFWLIKLLPFAFTLRSAAELEQEIEQRKKAEGRAAHLAGLIEKTSDIVFSYDAELRLSSWNKAAVTVYGYTPGEVIGQNVIETLRPVINAETRLAIRQEIMEKGFWAGETEHTRKNGSLVPVAVSLTVIRGAGNNIEEYVCICRDITQRKAEEEKSRRLQAEVDRLMKEQLSQSQKETSDYKYALDRANIVAITDQKGIIKHVNENFCRISGYTVQELVGQDHRIINSQYHPASFIRDLWVTIASGRVWKGEIKNKAKNGHFYWVDTTIVPFLDQHGKPYQYVAIRADITERKEAEEALQLMSEQLEERVQLRNRQLETANRDLEAFSYTVSHDLRAPLRAINGFARILEEDYKPFFDSEGSRLLQKIISNAGAMGQLIDDMLAFSRLGRGPFTNSAVDMQSLASACLLELGQNFVLDRYNITLEALPGCHGDPGMLKQVWLNLLGNALKYSANNPLPAIVAGSFEDGQMVVYYVKDNGVGFDMQYAHKLFGVFQRLHGHEEFEGTGVGLAIVKLIVERHHGAVWAEAVPGKGAAFYFSLPKK